MTSFSEGDIAEIIVQILQGELPPVTAATLGWQMTAWDFGEIEIITKDGSKFILVVTKE